METSYAEVSHEAKVPKPGLEPLEVTAGLRDIEPAEADDDKSWVEGELPAIVVADVVADVVAEAVVDAVEGEDAAAAAAACVVVQEQTDHVTSVDDDLVDTVTARFYPRRALLHSLWESGRFHNAALMNEFGLAAARPVAAKPQGA
jgi:hypothetical protein